jgi:GntR family transcriptional regulator, rspAB operon transcriptional repressor
MAHPYGCATKSSRASTEQQARDVWLAIAPRTMPEVSLHLSPEVVAITLGVETDVLGLDLDEISAPGSHTLSADQRGRPTDGVGAAHRSRWVRAEPRTRRATAIVRTSMSPRTGTRYPGRSCTSTQACDDSWVSTRPHSTGGIHRIAPVGRERVRARTSDRIYDELVSAIRTLRIPPGSSLSETDLSAQLEVSRTPLREAIVRLVDNGLVSVVPQVGTRVERIRLHDVEEARFVREALELAAFAEACERPDRDVSTMRALLIEQERCHTSHDLSAFFAADEALHQQIFVLSGHSGAWTMMQPMKLQLDRLRRLSLPESDIVRDLIDEHTAIVDALEAADIEGGQTLLRRHISRVRRYGRTLREQYPDYFAD